MTPVLPPVTLDELGVLSRRASTVIERLRERVFAPGSQKRLDLIYNVRTAAEMVGRSEKAIRDANLGLNPQADGNLVRVPVPPLTEDRRKDLVKVAGQYAESARVAVRNVRRDGMKVLKKLKSDGMSEDENKRHGEEVQKLTDEYIKKIDTILSDKEKDIMTV